MQPASDRLSPREQKFVREFLVDFNRTKAAIRSGFSPRSAHTLASRLLKKARVQKAIEKEQARLVAMTGITPERVLNELALLGFSNMADYLTGEGEERALDLRNTNREQMAAVSEYTVESYYEKVDDGRPREIKRVKMKLHDKRGALVDIGRHLGMFTAGNKSEVEVTEKAAEAAVAAKDELKRKYDKLAAVKPNGADSTAVH